jgi:hypothetical protein
MSDRQSMISRTGFPRDQRVAHAEIMLKKGDEIMSRFKLIGS